MWWKERPRTGKFGMNESGLECAGGFVCGRTSHIIIYLRWNSFRLWRANEEKHSTGIHLQRTNTYKRIHSTQRPIKFIMHRTVYADVGTSGFSSSSYYLCATFLCSYFHTNKADDEDDGLWIVAGFLLCSVCGDCNLRIAIWTGRLPMSCCAAAAAAAPAASNQQEQQRFFITNELHWKTCTVQVVVGLALRTGNLSKTSLREQDQCRLYNLYTPYIHIFFLQQMNYRLLYRQLFID